MSTPHPYPVSPSWRVPCRGVAASLLLTLFLTLQPCIVVSQPGQIVTVSPSPAYFSDQPIILLPVNNASVANFSVTFSYVTTMLLVLTNGTVDSAVVPTIANSLTYATQLPATNAAGLQGFLFTALSSPCKRADSQQSGQCSIDVTLTAAPQQSHVHYALYSLNIAQYGTTYTDTVAHNTWKYYVHYVQQMDLSVAFDLASPATTGQLTTAMFISAAHALFTPGYPSLNNSGAVTLNTAYDQTCLLPTGAPDVPDYYIVGLYGFSSSPLSSELQLDSDIDAFGDSSGFNGYAILSLLSLILAAGFIGLVLMRGCCMYRRINAGGGWATGVTSFSVDRTRTAAMVDASLFQTTAGQAGVLRTDRPILCASEAEIASLPVKTYVSSVGTIGEECEDSRCTICLDEYESNVSRITTLRCGHTFHSTCLGAWLRQRRYCPLCLQTIDQAQDVKQRRNSTVSPEVELAAIRPLPAAAVAVASPTHTSQVVSSTLVDDGAVSVLDMQRYSSAAQEGDADMCAIEIGTPHNVGRTPL